MHDIVIWLICLAYITYLYVNTCTHIHTHRYTYSYTHIYTHIHTHTYTYIHKHTYTHSCIWHPGIPFEIRGQQSIKAGEGGFAVTDVQVSVCLSLGVFGDRVIASSM